MGAGAEPLPRGTLLAIALAVVTVIVVVIAAGAIALFFEGTAAFLFETNAILLDIAREGRGFEEEEIGRAHV